MSRTLFRPSPYRTRWLKSCKREKTFLILFLCSCLCNGTHCFQTWKSKGCIMQSTSHNVLRLISKVEPSHSNIHLTCHRYCAASEIKGPTKLESRPRWRLGTFTLRISTGQSARWPKCWRHITHNRKLENTSAWWTYRPGCQTCPESWLWCCWTKSASTRSCPTARLKKTIIPTFCWFAFRNLVNQWKCARKGLAWREWFGWRSANLKMSPSW